MTRLADAGPGFDGLLLTDIAQAQEWLGAPGRLSRIDVRLPAGAAGAALLAALRARLPADVELHGTRAEARETFAMTDAFTTNLRAMSLLALLVGTFLIYGAVSFAVLQRRTIIGVLRALGATRARCSRWSSARRPCSASSAPLRGAARSAIGRGLVALVSRTINDLYFVVAVNELSAAGRDAGEGAVRRAGTGTRGRARAGAGGGRSAPQLGLARSVLEARAQRLCAPAEPARGLLLALGACRP